MSPGRMRPRVADALSTTHPKMQAQPPRPVPLPALDSEIRYVLRYQDYRKIVKHTEEYPTWVPAKAVFAVLTAVGVLLLGGCSGPRAGDAPTQPETTSRPDPTEQPETTQPETTQPEATQPEPEPEPACGDDVASVDDTVVTVCFVAFGDPSADGSGPHTLIEGVTIALLSTEGGLGGDRSVWWESVYAGAEEGLRLPLEARAAVAVRA